MSPEPIAIYSARGFGREVAWLLESLADRYRVVAFVDDDPGQQGRIRNGFPVWSRERLRAAHAGGLLACAIGAPAVRQRVVASCVAEGFRFPTLIHPGTSISDTNEIAQGVIVCTGSILTVNIRVEEQVHINLDCTIGHDVRIGAYTTLTPGVHISGCVHVGERVYIGTGANIINGDEDRPLVIADDTVIGAGAVLTRSTEPGSLYVGVPATRKR